ILRRQNRAVAIEIPVVAPSLSREAIESLQGQVRYPDTDLVKIYARREMHELIAQLRHLLHELAVHFVDKLDALKRRERLGVDQRAKLPFAQIRFSERRGSPPLDDRPPALRSKKPIFREQLHRCLD